jgi:ATP-dependent protease HslVU (ClpYQ) ATPase subunit
VELKALNQKDFYRILTEPQFNLVKQQQVGHKGIITPG